MKKQITLALTALALAGNCVAHETGDWLLRAGVTNVSPNDDSSNVFVGGTDLGVGVSADSNSQLGLNIVYMMTDRWALEVLAATPFSHDITLNTVGPLAESKQLPPTVSANYYFGDTNADFQPYAGIGLNYTVFFDEEFTAANKTAGFSDLDLDSSFGLAAQVGFDYKLKENWLLNASVRYISIDTDASFDLNGAAGSVSVDIDPTVYTLSIGYKF